ncbi:hypothetical protein FZEAL_8902 [Fusarium zealandicum]|uniref:Uncharacterized protein n=1 Tax=Fusarium zealandicum TaxID=1053134 RepID=A0A8H4UDW0_9HYPO|nr:hypothetical protein FZEAL_8902 [Fusarium zealandicum]
MFLQLGPTPSDLPRLAPGQGVYRIFMGGDWVPITSTKRIESEDARRDWWLSGTRTGTTLFSRDLEHHNLYMIENYGIGDLYVLENGGLRLMQHNATAACRFYHVIYDNDNFEDLVLNVWDLQTFEYVAEHPFSETSQLVYGDVDDLQDYLGARMAELGIPTPDHRSFHPDAVHKIKQEGEWDCFHDGSVLFQRTYEHDHECGMLGLFLSVCLAV